MFKEDGKFLIKDFEQMEVNKRKEKEKKRRRQEIFGYGPGEEIEDSESEDEKIGSLKRQVRESGRATLNKKLKIDKDAD